VQKWYWVTAVGVVAATHAFVASAQILLYEHDKYKGRTFSASNSVSNLNDSGFNDQASSAKISGGRWQLCADAYFRGNCVTLGPGEYPTLRDIGMSDKVSSVRELGWTPDGGGGWNSDSSNRYSNNNSYNNNSSYNTKRWGDGGNWGSGNRAVLYSGYNLSGETFVVNPSGISDLDRTGFNDKARSLRVESGYWIFCSDAGLQGNCHTYGPGDYPNLPSGQNHSISSGRQVSNTYPYRNNPNWSSASSAPANSGGVISVAIGAVPPVVRDLGTARTEVRTHRNFRQRQERLLARGRHRRLHLRPHGGRQDSECQLHGAAELRPWRQLDIRARRERTAQVGARAVHPT
jgi:hypothetical protein